jgi:tetratricopeptide (TPR) repeat protein
MRARRAIRIVAILAALHAATRQVEKAEYAVAVLLQVGSNATITLGDRQEKPLPAAQGDLIYAGARLITNGERARFLFLPDACTYEFNPTYPSYPAPSYQPIDKPNTQFEVRFITPKPIAQRGKLTAGEHWPIQFASLDLAHVAPAASGRPDDPAALKRIDAALSQPANSQDPALHLAKAIALERANQLTAALTEYRGLAREWTGAAWLQKKIPELASAAQVRQQQAALQSRTPRTYAVVIGISEYQRLASVPYADHDAMLFRAHLKSPRGGALPDNQVFTLSNKEATRAAVSNLLEQVFTRLAGPRDTVYLFFSGHGMDEVQQNAERGFLLESDSDPQEKSSSAYSLTELRNLIQARSRAVERIFLFADLCRAASYQHSPNRINAVVTEQLADISPQAAAMLSSGSEQESQAANDPEGGHGLFTYYLVKGLQGEADQDKNGSVTFDELFKYVEERVSRATANQQRPMEFGAVSIKYDLSDLRLPPIQARRVYRRRPEQFAALWFPPGMLFAPQASTELAADLRAENDGQQILLEYLRGDETAPRREVFERGRDLFAEAYRLNPSVPLEAKRLFCEGRALSFDKTVDPAIPLLEAAVRLDPTAAYAYNGLGIAYLKKGLLPPAAWSFRDAIRLAPHWIYPRHNLALTYMEAGAYTPAEKEYRDAIRLEGESASLHYGLGLLLHETNRNKEAGREYQRALEINPSLAEAHTGWGVVLASAGQTDEARKEYTRALQLKPDLAPALHNLALLYSRNLKNDAEAIGLWQKNIQLNPSFIESRLSLAATYSKTGKFEAAIEQYQEVLKESPQYTGVQRALLEAQGDRSAAANQKETAADLYRKALTLAVEEDDRARLKRKVKRAQK